jgi:hypothetical protein
MLFWEYMRGEQTGSIIASKVFQELEYPYDMSTSEEDGLQKQKWRRVFRVRVASLELDFIHNREARMDLFKEGID